MLTTFLLLIIIQLRQVLNLPHNYSKRSPLELKITSDLPPIILPSHVTQSLPPAFAPLLQPQNIAILTAPKTRKKKGPSYPLLPIPHQLLVTKLHVLPVQQSVHHNTIHTDLTHVVNNNVNIPIISQTISHGNANITQPTQLVPILIPIHHNHLVPIHDLSVIPLHREVHKVETKIGHIKVAMEKKDDEGEHMNMFRTFYGGFGQILFGGHGAGHGFYAYG